VFKVHGRGDREYVLSLSHEETFALIAKEIRSYKELPQSWQPGLRRDLDAAAGFFHHGPRALRDLRIRSGHRPRLLDRAAVERLLRAELEGALGPFRVLEPGTADPSLGRPGARRRALTEARRRLDDAAAVTSMPPRSAR
jgi:hypothetical protein